MSVMKKHLPNKNVGKSKKLFLLSMWIENLVLETLTTISNLMCVGGVLEVVSE